MTIREIRAFCMKPDGSYGAAGSAAPEARRPAWLEGAEVANPMSVHERFKALRSSWLPPLGDVGCLVFDEQGHWGFGKTRYGAPIVSLINEHFAPLLAGERSDDIERAWDMMMRLASPYSPSGLAAYAISAVDLALWDLNAKREGVPVYDLAGGAARQDIFCYATGNDTDWHMELGFGATKLACPYGPADGERGLAANEALVAGARDLIGPDVPLMLDCWMAFDVEYAAVLAARLAPYALHWMEDCLVPEDIDAHHELRRRLPEQRLATGEHWYGPYPFAHAAKHRLVDVFQPDICWVGGFTACRKIAAIGAGADIPVVLHAGMNTAYGQHFTLATANAEWGEFFVGSPPGVPLDKARGPAGAPVPENGRVRPSDAPGFGIELGLADIEARIV